VIHCSLTPPLDIPEDELSPKVVEVFVPLPPQGCQQNNRRHWRVVARAVKEYRLAAQAACQGKATLKPPVRVHHTWFMGRTTAELVVVDHKRYRPMDEGNAIGALKAAIDGLVDGKVLAGDTAKELRWGDCVMHRTAKEHQGKSGVLLTLVEEPNA
jgi:hypothetical protein